ncbi:hypothetical protein HDV63DRAFT_372553 [Trichoderma sp. SZMC 28014]
MATPTPRRVLGARLVYALNIFFSLFRGFSIDGENWTIVAEKGEFDTLSKFRVNHGIGVLEYSKSTRVNTFLWVKMTAWR